MATAGAVAALPMAPHRRARIFGIAAVVLSLFAVGLFACFDSHEETWNRRRDVETTGYLHADAPVRISGERSRDSVGIWPCSTTRGDDGTDESCTERFISAVMNCARPSRVR